ncbi:MAG: hypothetical protein QOC61_54 [Acidobacteriota bacterium]|jgi:hypothetical protein|nr:hypothetical protein [Acidobacteriota bacterium]
MRLIRQKLRTHTRLPALCVAFLLALLAPPVRARAETYWPDGYEVEINLHASQAVYMIGEPVELWLEIQNHSDTNLEMLLAGKSDGERDWPDDFDVSVVGPDGKAAPRPDDDEGANDAYTNSFVRAGQSNNLLFPLKLWAVCDKPGVYTATYRRGMTAGPYNGHDAVLFDMKKPAVEIRLRAQFEIVAGGDRRIGKLIDELGARMMVNDLSSSMLAATRLAAMDDERVVRYFVEALGKSRNPGIRYTALNVFSKFQSDLALEGLRLGAASADEDFRTAAATAILRSKHPQAGRLLLSMRDDSYYGVRLIVLFKLETMYVDRKLGAAHFERTRRMIWEMTNDPSEKVRDEALRYLQVFGARPRP